jgi:hypothetical protein
VKMVCVMHTMVSIPETAVSTNEKIFSAFALCAYDDETPTPC